MKKYLVIGAVIALLSGCAANESVLPYVLPVATELLTIECEIANAERCARLAEATGTILDKMIIDTVK